MKLRIIRALSPKSLFNLVDIYSCFFDYIISFSLNKLMCPVLIWKYQNPMPTIGNSPEYLYEVSDTKKFQTSDFLEGFHAPVDMEVL